MGIYGAKPVWAKHRDDAPPITPGATYFSGAPGAKPLSEAGARAQRLITQYLTNPSNSDQAWALTSIVDALKKLKIQPNKTIVEYIKTQLATLPQVALKALSLTKSGEPQQIAALTDALGCFPPPLSKRLSTIYTSPRITVAQNFLTVLPLSYDEYQTVTTLLQAENA